MPFKSGNPMPVTVTTRPALSEPAQPVYVVSTPPAVAGRARRVVPVVGGPIKGGAPIPAYNAGANALYTDDPPMPVYVVSGSLEGAGVAPSTLLNGLSLYLKLDETGGTRADAPGNVTPFTDNNTVLSATGKVGNAAAFVAASSEYLSHADNAVFQVGATSHTWAFWVNFTTLPAAGACLFSKTAVGDLSYWCDYDGTSRLRFIVTADGATPHIATANALGAPSTATWYFVLCTYDSPNNRIGIYINGDLTGNTTAHAGGVWPGTASFKVGARLPDEYTDGLIDEFGMYARLLTATEIGLLYNGGAGRAYPFVGA